MIIPMGIPIDPLLIPVRGCLFILWACFSPLWGIYPLPQPQLLPPPSDGAPLQSAACKMNPAVHASMEICREFYRKIQVISDQDCYIYNINEIYIYMYIYIIYIYIYVYILSLSLYILVKAAAGSVAR